MVEELLGKLKFVFSCNNDSMAERIIEQFIHRQEEDTILFTEWLRENCYDTGSHWYYQEDNEEYTSSEIFELFKKINKK